MQIQSIMCCDRQCHKPLTVAAYEPLCLVHIEESSELLACGEDMQLIMSLIRFFQI